jgi:hypothetical protein
MSRILFVMLHPGFVRYYEDGLLALADAGHDVHVAFEVSRTKLGEDVTARRLATRSPRLTCGTTPERGESVRAFLARADRQAVRTTAEARPWTRQDVWDSLATTVRLAADYLRFFEPEFAAATSLRARVEKRLPAPVSRMVRAIARARPTRRLAAGFLRALERTIPVPDDVVGFLRHHAPDLMLVTPLIELGSQQVDYVKAARRLGVPSALCVASWDNLTSKGLIRVVPDHVIVWNEAQVEEAVTLHRVARSQVVATGASLFDRWFSMGPTRTREAFCQAVGLDPARPFVLYVGSSVFIAPEEVPFAERWLDALRAAGHAGVAGLGALVRPHPANARQWLTLDLSMTPNAVVWPPIGTDPTSSGFPEDYFDSLYHCAAVVGINTSAQIEASVVGRPVLTVRAPEFAHAQAGTLHFRHLAEGHGAVQVAESLDEHVRQLAAILDGDQAWVEPTRAFVRTFVRPHGIDTPAAPIFAREVGALVAQERPRPRPDGLAVGLARGPALCVAYMARATAEGRPLWIYAARPVITAAVWVMAVPAFGGEWWRERVRPSVKRARRHAWSAWYESTQQVARTRRTLSKRLWHFVREAGGAAKRAVGFR